MKSLFISAILLSCAFDALCQPTNYALSFANSAKKENPMLVFEPFIGTWQVVQADSIESIAPEIKYEWTLDKRAVVITTSIDINGKLKKIIEGIVTWHPWDRTMISTEYNILYNLVYIGEHISADPNSIQKIYDVFSQDQRNNNKFDQLLSLNPDGTSSSRTKILRNGIWEQFMPPSTLKRIVK